MFKEKTNESHSLNAQKMSYFSDIDLATLHRSRLNERIQYKLSWFNRKQKYCIPRNEHQSRHRDNPIPPIKTTTNHHTFRLNHKTPYQMQNNSNVINEKNPSNTASNDIYNRNNATTDRPKKSASNGKVPSTIDNHCDKSTEETRIDCIEITTHKRPHATRNNSTLTNNRVNKIDLSQSLADSYVSSAPVTLASGDADLFKNRMNRNLVHGKCSSGEQISRNAHNMSNATGDIPCPCTEASSADHAHDGDLNLPHRKRSGTWP